MLNVSNVFLKYTKEYNTLNDITFNVEDGENVIIYGEKESGKSSLLRVVAGLQKATSGDVYIKDIDIKKINYKTDVSLGYISCVGAFLNKTVEQNLTYVLKIRKLEKDIIKSKVNGVLLTYDLVPLKDRKIKDLSDFDKMRVSIARLALRKLDLLIIDDIFVNFSEEEVQKLVSMVNNLIEINECASLIAISNKKMLDVLKGRVLKLKFGSIVN